MVLVQFKNEFSRRCRKQVDQLSTVNVSLHNNVFVHQCKLGLLNDCELVAGPHINMLEAVEKKS